MAACTSGMIGVGSSAPTWRSAPCRLVPDSGREVAADVVVPALQRLFRGFYNIFIHLIRLCGVGASLTHILTYQLLVLFTRCRQPLSDTALETGSVFSM